MRKTGYHEITGVIHCLSGLRVGGSDELLQIGGTDLTCIKHPVTLRPYIPGSSIKGRMRWNWNKNSASLVAKTRASPAGVPRKVALCVASLDRTRRPSTS